MPPHLNASPPQSPIRPAAAANNIEGVGIVDDEERKMKFSFYESSSSVENARDVKENTDELEPPSNKNVHRFYQPLETHESNGSGAKDAIEGIKEQESPSMEAPTTSGINSLDITASTSYESNVDSVVVESTQDVKDGIKEEGENTDALEPPSNKNVHQFYQPSETHERNFSGAKDAIEGSKEQESPSNKSVYQFYKTSEAPASGILSLDAKVSTSYESNVDSVVVESTQHVKDDIKEEGSRETDVTPDVTDYTNGSTKFSFYESNIDHLPTKNTEDVKVEVNNEEETQPSNKNVHQFYEASDEPRTTISLELKNYTRPSSRRFHLSSMNANTMENLQLLQLYHENKKREATLLEKYGFGSVNNM